MGNFWILNWWWIIIFIIIAQQKARRRRQMGPRVHIAAGEFVDIAEKEQGLVIKSKRMYLIRSGDYYYYTTSKQPLSLPAQCQVKEVKNILL
jgi:hypothetical protein